MGQYRSEARAYHTPRHLEECLEQFDAARGLFRRPDEAEAAIWFHDAIYDPHADDNEEESANLADRLLGRAGVATEFLAEIRRLILATGHRGVRIPGDDSSLVTDIDLVIFGADPARFDQYERDIRREYAFAAEDEFRRRRAQILESFLARPAIYAVPVFAERYEERARANLRRSIAALRNEGPHAN
jgi:predicted metal-dependent HD superfamily phosphohydrolase